MTEQARMDVIIAKVKTLTALCEEETEIAEMMLLAGMLHQWVGAVCTGQVRDLALAMIDVAKTQMEETKTVGLPS